MMRLAYRILSQNTTYPIGVKIDSESAWLQTMEACRRILHSCPIIVADNIADLYGSDKGWDFGDVPNLAPPFDEFFVEFRDHDDNGDEAHVGCLVVAEDLRKQEIRDELLMRLEPGSQPGSMPQVADAMSRSRWLLEMKFWMTMMSRPTCGRPLFLGATVMIFVTGDGQYVLDIVSLDPAAQSLLGGIVGNAGKVALLAVSFMHCKNVTLAESEGDGQPEKWHRRTKIPELKFHVLQIDPMREILRNEGGSESNGIRKSLHICRGHFARYTDDRPLFGRVTGTFWRPSHVRGSVRNGTVTKDYAVGK